MYSTVLFHLVFLLGAALAQTPAASGSAAEGTVDILTSFTGYAGCSADQTNMLKQAAKDAVTIADAGLDTIRDELLLAIFFPQRNHKQVDFSKEAAIEYFGPEKENYPEQARVFGELLSLLHGQCLPLFCYCTVHFTIDQKHACIECVH